jgi:hypothetical protein
MRSKYRKVFSAITFNGPAIKCVNAAEPNEGRVVECLKGINRVMRTE